MASNISVLVKFSDGTMTYLRDTVTLDTLTEIQTDASNILNLTGDVSVGQAYVGKTATHALAKVVTDSAASGAFCYAAFYGPDGSVLCPIQGGGYRVTGLPKLAKPVVMTTGTVCKAQAQAQADSVQIGSLAVFTSSGKCDVFFGLGSDDANVSMLNAQGSTYGQSLAGHTVVAAYATYGATYGLADTGIADGIGAFFVESSTGQLKMLYSPAIGAADVEPVSYIPGTHRVDQNDTLTIRANV